ncbi:hypothetical protein OIU79_018522 [Salix purpurea]|uniref:Synergin gamma C-terminal domain-containing protein n=1 Tax=Salix purpurea TaxID=77065 RepID=A0A9Q1AL24_SALPP|nr:hypothetical protein OIU79_018522 [Salix purpurea]
MTSVSDFTNTNNTDDDDWGDFNFVIESLAQPGLAPSLVNNLTQWDKPKGALPLSAFGEIEEEEGSGASEPRNNESFDFLRIKEGSGGVVEELDSKGLGLDLKENELNSNKMGSNLIKKDRNLSGNGVSLGLVHGNEGFDDDKWGFEGADRKSDVEIGISKAGEMRTENGLVSNVYGSNSSWNPLSVDLNGWTSHVNGDNSSSKMQAGDEKEKGDGRRVKNSEGATIHSLGSLKMHFPETGSKNKEEAKVVEVSTAVEAFPFVGEIKGNMARSISQKGALPLSIFGDEEEDSNDPVSYRDISSELPDSKPIDDIKSHSINAINDLISSLYGQAEHNTALINVQNPSGNGLSPINTVMESNLAGDNDDFDDDSWEFKDASSGTRAEDQVSFIGLGEANTDCSSKTELNDYVDFFCKLKEELHCLALCHLDNLKKAQSAASEDAEVKALEMEIQNLHDELCRDGLFSGEVDSGNHSPRRLCLNEFVEVLQEPKYQGFDSEYQLSSKLSLVENDLRLTMEFLRHVASTIKILTLVSREEQSCYISTWSEILSVCARELKHGAIIWMQSLQKDVHDQILSKPQGKNYIVSLGEIYRVIEVIGSSARLYKPWKLCKSISDPAGADYNRGLTTLIESIKNIQNLDTLTLYNHVFSGQGPICRLSVLTAGAVPGMKMVVWNGENYFLTLANLWANLLLMDSNCFMHDVVSRA